jgi:CheY-like chemotaxis protein/anti-sigma regulatory factor (Ser/Thr protein kinase)
MKRVLLVEDDEAVRTVLSLVLQRNGWNVEATAGAADAERSFAVRRTDVILSDLVMPGKGALELLADLRVHDPRLAFVVMSGFLTDERFRDALQAGASDCLAKPCESDTLMRALERAIVLRHCIAVEAPPEGEHAMVVSVPADLAQRATVFTQVDLAAQAGGFDRRRNRILLALDEAFTNAVVHGARSIADKRIEVRASFSNHGGVVTVSDPGPGFDPALADEGLDGAFRRRGLFLITIACDDARWIGRGNVCQMIFKQPPRSETGSASEMVVVAAAPAPPVEAQGDPNPQPPTSASRRSRMNDRHGLRRPWLP